MTGASSISDRKCCSLSLDFVCRDWKKNRLWQRTHRQGTMKRRLSIHSNVPCLLERRISEHPHFKHTIGFMAASTRTLLPDQAGSTKVLSESHHDSGDTSQALQECNPLRS